LNWLIELAKDLATLAHVTKMLATSKIHICNIHTYLYEKKNSSTNAYLIGKRSSCSIVPVLAAYFTKW
jgi:hypothetical protein